jgi:hypothetical protein
MEVPALAKWIAGVGGAALVIVKLMVQSDEALIRHLEHVFASKSDVARIEQKIDQLLEKKK